MDCRLARVTHVGMDIHKQFSRVTACDANGKVVFRQRLEHADRAALRGEFGRWPAGTPVILEGTFGWGWMSDELLACGLKPHLTSGAKTKGWRQSLGKAKNNRLDADLLSTLWREPDPWWEVWLAPPAVRQQREWLRYRMGLVQTQSVCKNRVQAVLHRHGILHPHSDLFGVQGRQLLKQLSAPEDGTLPPSAQVTIQGSLELLESLRVLLAQVTRQLRQQIVAQSDAELWRSLPGIGWILAYTIQAEIGSLERFKDAGHLAAYSLLAPRDDDSGDEDTGRVPSHRHVGQFGRQTLKWAFKQASYSAIRKSPRLQALFDRITDQGRRDRGRGFTAVAHELCRIGYSCVKYRRAYNELAPPGRPGSAGVAHHRTSHSGAGQPVLAMVAVAPQGVLQT